MISGTHSLRRPGGLKGLISHDLRTALIDPKGKLVHLWKSNVWTPYEVQRRLRQTLTGSEDMAVR